MKTTGLNFLEAVQAANDGCMVRRASWGACYVKFRNSLDNNERLCFTTSNKLATLTQKDYVAKDWLVFVEPPKTMTFMAALAILTTDRQKKIRRLAWTKSDYVYLNDARELRKDFRSIAGFRNASIYNPSYQDCIADDWIEVEGEE